MSRPRPGAGRGSAASIHQKSDRGQAALSGAPWDAARTVRRPGAGEGRRRAACRRPGRAIAPLSRPAAGMPPPQAGAPHPDRPAPSKSNPAVGYATAWPKSEHQTAYRTVKGPSPGRLVNNNEFNKRTSTRMASSQVSLKKQSENNETWHASRPAGFTLREGPAFDECGAHEKPGAVSRLASRIYPTCALINLRAH